MLLAGDDSARDVENMSVHTRSDEDVLLWARDIASRLGASRRPQGAGVSSIALAGRNDRPRPFGFPLISLGLVSGPSTGPAP